MRSGPGTTSRFTREAAWVEADYKRGGVCVLYQQSPWPCRAVAGLERCRAGPGK